MLALTGGAALHGAVRSASAALGGQRLSSSAGSGSAAGGGASPTMRW